MQYHKLGKGSEANLVEVKGMMEDVVRLALKLCKIDFSVVDGLRTFEQQAEYLRIGASMTMKSKHLPDDTGLSGAVDIYPWVDGTTSHDGYHYALIARAMFEAAIILNVQIRWGGFWARTHRKDKFEGFDKPHWELFGHVPLAMAA